MMHEIILRVGDIYENPSCKDPWIVEILRIEGDHCYIKYKYPEDPYGNYDWQISEVTNEVKNFTSPYGWYTKYRKTTSIPTNFFPDSLFEVE